MALDYAPQAHLAFSAVQAERGATLRRNYEGEVHTRNKMVLMVIDMCPLCWILGIDRFYLGNIGLGIAKLSVCIITAGFGGIVWGLVDFVTVVQNALRREQAIRSMGMSATFSEGELRMAEVL